MTVERGAGAVVITEPGAAAVAPSELLSDRDDIRLRTVERTAAAEWAESVRRSTRECLVLSARSADGPWRDTVATLRAAAPTAPVVLVSDGQVARLASAAASEGVDAYLDLTAETAQSLAETIAAVVARRERRPVEADPADAPSLADLAADPMFLLKRDGRVGQCNTALCSLLDAERDAVVGRPVRSFVPADDSDRLEALVADGRAGGTLETRIETPDGEGVPCEFSVAPAGGAATGAVVVARDLTERKRHEAHLRRRAERLEEFASVVSHDLRNPLNVAMGRLELIGDDHDGDHLATIDGAHRRMEEIIDNLLSMARTGRTTEQRRVVSVEESARAAWDLVETGDATLTVEFGSAVEADPGRLQQLFENLFRNAVDHTDGAPAVHVGPMPPIQTTTRGTADVEPTGFCVADDGPGIPPEERDDVFEYGTTSADGGTGFGLAIVRDIALEHGWQIHVTAGDRGGACFEVSGVRVAPAGE